MSEPEGPKGPLQETVRKREPVRHHSQEGSGPQLAERDRKAFGELIDLAERVQAERDSLRRQMYFSIGGFAFLTIAAGSLLFTIFDITSIDRPLSTAGGLLAAITTVGSYVAGSAMYILLARRLKRESKAFREVMDIVHELYGGLRKNLSPLELAEIRVRLSRLDN